MKTLSMYLGSIIGNNDTCIESLLDDEDLFYDHEKDIVIILDELRKQKLFAVSFRRDTEHFKLEYQPNTQTLQFFTDGFPQLADIAVRLPTNGSKPGGAVEPQREKI